MISSSVRRIAVTFLATAGSAALLLGLASTQHVMPGHLTPGQSLGQLIVPPPQRVFGKPSLRVLVVGLDYDYSSQDEETSAHSRSDIIMAVKLNFAHPRIDELSVPRDMVATMPGGQRAKINQAQSEGGIAESESVVAHWLGVSGFDRYVVLRIDTMKDLIDALGGTSVTVENSDALRHAGPNGPIDYDDSWGHLHVHLRPGPQHLSGEQAVGYARFRHDWCSDPCRIMRQQQVIHALAGQIEAHQFATLLRARPLLDVMRKDVETNLTPGEELSLFAAFARLGAHDIVTAQVPYTTSIDLPGYGDSIVADEAAKQRLVAAMLQ
jgi:polyisoprenyl-teichoic acid--peptidoglycan teichoic acid transferase